ncbi:MAG TPA: hypothetical protein PKK06_15930 [Phycisphaerae bacterium]|nr:hypothetical protein [Phycisphaerae bacterium]HNU47039.1 hypothetical protein [Phycisphaerae bacterium]
MSRLRIAELVLLALSVVITTGTMLRAGGVEALLTGFALWSLFPYGVFFALTTALHSEKCIRGLSGSACVAALCMFWFTLLAYGPGARGSSTACLIFLFAPFYLTVGGFVILFVGLAIARAAGRRVYRDGLPHCDKCGYLLIGLSESRCPECGRPFDPDPLGDPATWGSTPGRSPR